MLIKAKPKRRRPFVTQDGTAIPRGPLDRGEAYPIADTPIALDEQPPRSHAPVTFDGACARRDE